MPISWSPHPRYRLYTSLESYRLPLANLLPFVRSHESRVKMLEDEICRRFGCSAAVCVPSARTGLHFALQEMIRPGRKVVMSPLTIVDVVNMVILAGGVPVFADIDRRSCAIDPERAEALIDDDTGAVLITHLHGEAARAHDFKGICRQKGIPLIEDASQAIGAEESSKKLGTIGDLGIYSFGFFKNVNSWRGGMLVSRDADLIGRIRRRMTDLTDLPALRLFALSLLGLIIDLATWPPLFASVTHPLLRLSTRFDVEALNKMLDPEAGATRLLAVPPSYLKTMSETQAQLAHGQLARLDSDSSVRIAHAEVYDDALSGLEGLITPRRREGLAHIYTYYPIQYKDREALLRYALLHGKDFAAQFLRNCADLPEFKEFYRDCPNARAASRELILLPTYPRYPVSEVRRNVNIILQFLHEHS